MSAQFLEFVQPVHYLWAVFAGMPEICRPCTNHKVKLCMYADDEDPPHFHVRGPGISAKIDLATLKITRGWVPKKELDELVAYASANKPTLYLKWSELNERD